jgi:hypothetical protein
VDKVDALNTYAMVNFNPADPDPYHAGEVSDVGFASFGRNLRSIQAIAKEFGAAVMLVSQAYDERDIQAASRDNQMAAMERMTEIMRRLAYERKLVFVDAKPEVDEAARRAVDPDVIFTGEVHLTERGADVLARILAREVLNPRHGLLDMKWAAVEASAPARPPADTGR